MDPSEHPTVGSHLHQVRLHRVRCRTDIRLRRRPPLRPARIPATRWAAPTTDSKPVIPRAPADKLPAADGRPSRNANDKRTPWARRLGTQGRRDDRRKRIPLRDGRRTAALFRCGLGQAGFDAAMMLSITLRKPAAILRPMRAPQRPASGPLNRMRWEVIGLPVA